MARIAIYRKFVAIFLTLLSISVCATSLHAEPSADTVQPLRFGVLSIAPPSRIYKNWQPFTEYLSAKMQRPITIVVPRGFKKMKGAVEQEEIDFFYINSHVFHRLKQEDRAIGVLQMKNIKGDITSQSEIFVRKDSGIQNIDQLKGQDIAYISPMGAGGYLAPRAYLMSHGVDSGAELKEHFTKNLSSSIHNVLLNDTAAGTMCGVNFNLMSKKMDMGELNIIAISDPYPENLIAARPTLDAPVIEKFKQVVINMASDPAGRKILNGMHRMKIKEFISYDSGIEKITEKLLQQAQLKH